MKSTRYQTLSLLIISATLVITSTLLFNTAQAESSNESITGVTTSSPSPAVLPPKIVANDKTNNQKESQPNEKRELSSFFKIGIGLNIVMLMAFIYWAVGQWRQNKK